VVDLDDLLPRLRTPADHRDLVHDPRTGPEVLRVLAGSPYPFVRSAVAACPRADAAALAAVPTDDLDRWTRNEVLLAIARHPNADRAVLLSVLDRTSALLGRPGERPFAAAMALARRTELGAEEVLALTRRPGASSRMTRGVRRMLSERGAMASQ
jgi:hypothetical protein